MKLFLQFVLLLQIIFIQKIESSTATRQPNFIFILSDDLGAFPFFYTWYMVYYRHAQHTARGPNVARGSFKPGPWSPKFCLFSLFFQEKILCMCKNFGPWTLKKKFLVRHGTWVVHPWCIKIRGIGYPRIILGIKGVYINIFACKVKVTEGDHFCLNGQEL
jgi:hypothetical protein